MARHISVSDYTYALPEERIARHPLSDRASSKLLCYRNGQITDHIFRELPDILSSDTTLIFNTTKVVCARLLFPVDARTKRVEIFVLEPTGVTTMEQAMAQKGEATWKCLVGHKKCFVQNTLRMDIVWQGVSGFVEVHKPVASGDSFLVHFTWSPQWTFSEMLDAAGQIPLPPYMKRDADEEDAIRYQTIYAKEEGSVAAPTAGLHFTEAVIDALKSNDVHIAEVALHVGAGTFRPVKSATMQGHEMHAEEIAVSRYTVEALIAHPDTIIAVGTTSLRTLESLFWIGLKWHLRPDGAVPEVLQWDAYDIPVPEHFYYREALQVILDRMQANGMQVLTTKTQLLIAPGYTIRSIKALITNFHQPDSTLLLLVATCIGDDWRKVYAHALMHEYRFLSYGDSSLLWLV